MANIGLVYLRDAIDHGELRSYLVSHPRYTIHSQNGINVMNDFDILVRCLNEYGSENLGFDKILHDTMLEILSEHKVFYTYSLANIIYRQLDLEKNGKSLINFIDDQLLIALKDSVNSHKSRLSSFFDFEGFYFKAGLLGVYESIDKCIYNNAGRHIL